jgi:hypothetical protein
MRKTLTTREKSHRPQNHFRRDSCHHPHWTSAPPEERGYREKAEPQRVQTSRDYYSRLSD